MSELPEADADDDDVMVEADAIVVAAVDVAATVLVADITAAALLGIMSPALDRAVRPEAPEDAVALDAVTVDTDAAATTVESVELAGVTVVGASTESVGGGTGTVRTTVS